MIDEILAYNKHFTEEKSYKKYLPNKYMYRKIAILTCMDTHLGDLLPAALGLRHGAVKILKNAGGIVTDPFGSVIRSLLIAIIEMGVEEVMVIGHADCTIYHTDSELMSTRMRQRGITEEAFDMMKYCGIDFDKWISGFDTVDESVEDTVNTIRNHPLIPKDVRVGGYVFDTGTGALYVVC